VKKKIIGKRTRAPFKIKFNKGDKKTMQLD
jgi:hypothetical protein